MTTVDPSWEYTLHLPRDPRSPGIGRVMLRAALAARGRDAVASTAEVVAAELLANAQCHTSGPYALSVSSCLPGRVRVGVWDTDPRVPVGFRRGGRVEWVSGEAEGGRGLALVRACADDIGGRVLEGSGGESSRGGKLLWAECRSSPGRPRGAG
ncbi:MULTISPECIES: ATP-binding protein [unclassified Streptomyces]|uniref:ATP-binding protein n=1 Tax=unclassified Streptomyces TaxID=2593676 RepID=UPI0019048D1B|nr:ATP-binding protein [Streptomyces sp. HSG2]